MLYSLNDVHCDFLKVYYTIYLFIYGVNDCLVKISHLKREKLADGFMTKQAIILNVQMLLLNFEELLIL